MMLNRFQTQNSYMWNFRTRGFSRKSIWQKDTGKSQWRRRTEKTMFQTPQGLFQFQKMPHSTNVIRKYDEKAQTRGKQSFEFLWWYTHRYGDLAWACRSCWPWLVFFFGALLWGSMIHKHTERWIWQGSASVVPWNWEKCSCHSKLLSTLSIDAAVV